MADSENFILDAGAMINVAVLEAQASQGQKLLKGFAKELALIKQQQVEVDKKVLSETSKINEDHRRQMEALKKDTKSSVNEIAQAYVLLTETTRASFAKLHEGSSRAIHSLGEKEIATMNAMTEAANRLTDAQKNLSVARGTMRGGVGMAMTATVDPETAARQSTIGNISNQVGWINAVRNAELAATEQTKQAELQKFAEIDRAVREQVATGQAARAKNTADAERNAEMSRSEAANVKWISAAWAEGARAKQDATAAAIRHDQAIQRVVASTKNWSTADAEVYMGFHRNIKEIQKLEQEIQRLSAIENAGPGVKDEVQIHVNRLQRLNQENQKYQETMEKNNTRNRSFSTSTQQIVYAMQDFVSAGGTAGQMMMGFRGALNNIEMALMNSTIKMSAWTATAVTLVPTVAFASFQMLDDHFDLTGKKAANAAKEGLEKYKTGIESIIDATERLTKTEQQREEKQGFKEFGETRKGALDVIKKAKDDLYAEEKHRDSFTDKDPYSPMYLLGMGNIPGMMEGLNEKVRQKQIAVEVAMENLRNLEAEYKRKQSVQASNRFLGKERGKLIEIAAEGLVSAGSDQGKIQSVRQRVLGLVGKELPGEDADGVTNVIMDEAGNAARAKNIGKAIENADPKNQFRPAREKLEAAKEGIEALQRVARTAKDTAVRPQQEEAAKDQLKDLDAKMQKINQQIDDIDAQKKAIERQQRDNPQAGWAAFSRQFDTIIDLLDKQWREMKGGGVHPVGDRNFGVPAGANN